MDWKQEYQEKICTPQEAVKLVRSGDRVYAGTASSIAYRLLDALWARREELDGVVLCGGMTSRPLPFFQPQAAGHFSTTTTFFAGAGERQGIRNRQTTFTSVHLSQIETWCRETARPDVAFLEVSPPDEEGYLSYGAFGTAFHDVIRALARTVVLQVNPHVPYVYGEKNRLHISQADAVVEAEDALDTVPNLPLDETLRTLSGLIVEQIPDGATLQLGLGGISNAVGFALREKNDLGIHTEMFTDSMMELARLGVVTNRKKTFLPGTSVASFALGTRALYDYLDHNEALHFAPYAFVNDSAVIARNDSMISVNTAMAVDLYGQVAADCLGGRQQSAIGGQVDFVRGAQMSRGGKSFIALTSTHTKGDSVTSRIVPVLPAGSAVTTSRADVQYVATEYGCVNLKPLTMDDRARALIRLAHPDFRDELADSAKQMGLL